MNDDPEDLQEIFKDMVVTDPDRSIHISSNINYKIPEIRAAFNQAAHNIDVVNESLFKKILGREDVYITRSDPNDSTNYNFKKELASIVPYLEKQGEGQTLSPEEKTALNKGMNDLAEKSGVSRGYIDGMADQFLKNYQRRYTDYNIEYFNDALNGAKREGSTAKPAFIADNGQHAYMTVEHINGPQSSGALLKNMGFPEEDLPKKPPPMTAEQYEFFVALHEAEHTTRHQQQPFNKDHKEFLRFQAQEIDADSATLATMRNLGEPAIANYWLSYRNTMGFYNELYAGEDASTHSTASYLRLRDAGIDLDIEKYALQRKALMDKVRQEIDITGSTLKYDQVRSAVEDMLEKDKTERDPAKKLTAYEKWELKQIVQDYKDTGYDERIEYPKPALNVSQRPGTEESPALSKFMTNSL